MSATSNSLAFEWNKVANAIEYEVTFNGVTSTTNETQYEAIDLNPETEYEISVKAIGDGKFYLSSDSGSVSATTKPANNPGEEEKVEYVLLFGSKYNSKGISSYTSSWSVSTDGFKCNMVNWNNNNNGWSYVKAGSKNSASVATITTASPISESIKTVTMTVDAVTLSSINSVKLYVSAESDFSNAKTYTTTVAKGAVTFSVAVPTPNCYYKIEVDCKKASSNGPIQVSKVVFAN